MRWFAPFVAFSAFLIVLGQHVGQPVLPLSKWLEKVPFHAQNIELTIPLLKLPLFGKLNLTLNVHTGTCSGLRIEKVRVPTASGDRHGFIVEGDLGGLKVAECHFNASVRLRPAVLPMEVVSISFSLASGGCHAALRVSMDGAARPLPTAASVPPGSAGCQVEIRFATLHFAGAGVLPAFMNRFVVPFMKSALGEKALGVEVCRLIRELVAQNGTVILKRILNPATIRPPPQRESPRFGTSALDWKHTLDNSAFARAVYSFATEVLLINNISGLNQNLQTILRSAGTQWPPRAEGPWHASIPFASSGFTVQLQTSNLSCDSLDVRDLRGNVTKHTISVMGAVALNCSAVIGARLDGVGFPSLDLKPQLFRIGVDKAGVEVLGTVGLRPDFFGMHIDQMQRVPCILGSVAEPADANRSGLELLGYALTMDWLKVGSTPPPTVDPLVAQVLPALFRLVDGVFLAAGPSLVALLAGRDVAEVVTSLVNNALATRVASHPPCPDTMYDPGTVSGLDVGSTYAVLVLGAALVVALFVAQVAMPLAHLWQRRRGSAEEPIVRVAWLPFSRGDGADSSDGFATAALWKLPVVGRSTAVLIPILILFNMAIFLMANAVVVVNITAKAWTDNTTQAIPPIFSFGTWNTAMWFARTGCWPLAILAIAWTIIWPFAKLLAMLMCWSLSPRVLSVSCRDTMLTLLDQVGKYSLFDPLLMTILIVGFKFNWIGEDAKTHVVSQISLGAEPTLGYFLLIIGTIFSLILGEVIIHFNRMGSRLVQNPCEESAIASRLSSVQPCGTVEPSSTTDPGETCSRRQGLLGDSSGAAPASAVVGCQRAPLDAHGVQGPVPLRTLVGASASTQASIIILLVVSFATFFIGCFMVDFHFEFGGLLGGLYVVMGEQIAIDYTVPQWVTGMAPDRMQSAVGMWCVCVGAWIVVLIVPFVYLLGLSILWFVPMTAKRQVVLFTISQVLGAWAILDIVVAAILVAVLGGSTFGVGHFIHIMLHEGVLSPTAEAVKRLLNTELAVFGPALNPGIRFLVVAAIGMNIVGVFMYRSTKRVLDARLSQ